MNLTRTLALATLFAINGGFIGTAAAQDKPWKDGTVWSVTFVKTKAGMRDKALTDRGAPQ